MTDAKTQPVNSSAPKSGVVRKVMLILAPILIIIGTIIATHTLIQFLEEPEERQRNFSPLAVMADYAREETVQLEIFTQGEVRPRTEITLVPQVGGKIVYVSPNFIEGGIIKKGEVLLQLEDADYHVSVMRAQASVAQAEQVLVREKAEGVLARQDFEELGHGGAPNALVLRKPQQAQAEASLQAAQAELDAANLNLSRTKITAPFTGRVRSKSSGIGQFVSPGSPLGQIFSTDIVQVRLPLTNADLAKLNLPLAYVAKNRASAPNVILSANVAGARQNWQGQIMRLDGTYDTQTRALYAFVEVLSPYGTGMSDKGVPLAPGLFVDAQIAGKFYKNVIVIARDGLRPNDEVYVVDKTGQAEVRAVEVLDKTAERAVLQSGVSQGEMIVLSPLERSRLSIPLKVLNVNDPSEVWVEPKKPSDFSESEQP